MGYVKILFQKDIHQKINYVLNESKCAVVIDYICFHETAAKSWLRTQEYHHKRNSNEVIMVVQSWNEEDSKKLTPQMANELGNQLGERYFKDHQFFVATHTDTKHLHNHIMVNPVSFVEGNRIANKKKHLYNLAEINNQISKENNLTYSQDITETIKNGKFSYSSRLIQHHRKASFIMEIKDKVAFSSRYASSFDEFKNILREFNIQTKVKDDQVYFKTTEQKNYKSGKKLGKNDIYTLDAINKKVSSNKIKLEGIKQDLIIDSIRSAKSKDLISYANAKGIDLSIDEKSGASYITSKKHIYVSKDTFFNVKNKTSGNIIDFVKNAEGVSYIAAIKKLSSASGIGEVVNRLGKYDAVYNSFTFQTQKQLSGKDDTYRPQKQSYEEKNRPIALSYNETIQNISKSIFTNPNLRKLQRFARKVERADKYVKLVSDHSDDVYNIYKLGEGAVTKKGFGVSVAPFYSNINGSTLNVYFDPIEYLTHVKTNSFSTKFKLGEVVLINRNTQVLNKILMDNSSINKINFLSNGRELSLIDIKFLEKHKDKKISLVDISLSSSGISKDKSKAMVLEL